MYLQLVEVKAGYTGSHVYVGHKSKRYAYFIRQMIKVTLSIPEIIDFYFIANIDRFC